MKRLLAELFETYYRDIYTYLYSLCGDASLSEDLTSDVFLEVIQSISSFRGDSDIKTWLYTISRRVWFRHLRKKKRQIPTQSIHDLPESRQLGCEDAFHTQEAAQMMHRILNQESKLTRDVVQMRIEGYSYYEIARKNQVSESSARVLYFRAKNKIKKYLEQEGLHYG